MTVINIRSRKQGSAQSQLCSQTTVAFSSICSTSPDSPAMGSSHFRSNMQVLQQVTHENGEKYHIKSIDHHMIPDELNILNVESKSPIILNITEYHGMNRLNCLIHPAARTVLGYSATSSAWPSPQLLTGASPFVMGTTSMTPASICRVTLRFFLQNHLMAQRKYQHGIKVQNCYFIGNHPKTVSQPTIIGENRKCLKPPASVLSTVVLDYRESPPMTRC